MNRISALVLGVLGSLSLLPVVQAEPEQLLETGSFEWPPVVARKTKAEGADVTKSAMNAEWVRFTDKPDAEGGQLLLGLTNRVFRTGRQCLFVEFNKLAKPMVKTELSSDMLPILPSHPYRVAIWGRIDKERPITLAQRSPYLKLRVDWFKEDREEQTGESVWKAQPIPGPKNRKPLFVAHEWKEFFATVKSPEDAAFVKITWSWETPPQEGETDGVIYFDDATLFGESGPKDDPLAEIEKEEQEKEAAEAAGKAPGAAPAPGNPPAASPAPEAGKPPGK
jgi:hypothetical protein